MKVEIMLQPNGLHWSWKCESELNLDRITDHPSLSAAFTFTPKSSRNFTIWWCPAQTALWRGVIPSSLGMLGFSTLNRRNHGGNSEMLIHASVLSDSLAFFKALSYSQSKSAESELNSFCVKDSEHDDWRPALSWQICRASKMSVLTQILEIFDLLQLAADLLKAGR